MKHELAKQYDPAQVEARTYAAWLERGYFRAERREGSKGPYTIMMPPPNVTGQLHMGHALVSTLQDILIRWKRMQGYDALWLPGTDHAAIATEVKIVEEMAKEGLTKADVGYDAFMTRAWAWKEKYGGRIVEQLKTIGCSCDWSRERFTMDEGCSRAVKEVFVSLYEKGLIYRGERIINWCPSCKTTLSDAEVEHSDHEGAFWHIRYPYADGSGYIEVATTRPETMLGDTAVAVHPEDPRYKDKIGKTLILPLVGREIPVVADEYVEMDFGTGAVKITPAHDPNDFEVGLRHSLPVISVMNEDGTMNAEAGEAYGGLDRYDCRKRLVKDLEVGGFLLKTEAMTHSVGECYRCGTVAEPRVSTQWFVRMRPLAGPAVEAVKSGGTKFVPERFEKVYYHWMENIRDWCISRQLWWGHRIPAWYCGDCGELTVSRETPAVCPKCGSARLTQDPDSLDTWFSSALWPFSTLGWPEKTDDLAYFYPTNTLVTAYDIIFFWVARMIFSGLERMGETPFDTVFMHGLVRDAQGRKMSKSLGNGIDPMDVIARYGADALRFTLAAGTSLGNDMRFSDEKVEASRNFANKIWNAARFVLMNLGEDEAAPHIPGELAPEDRWVLSKYNGLVRDVTDNLEKFELGLAVQKLYDFLWDIYCDWYIELTKPRLAAGGDQAERAKAVLVYVLSGTLRLLHPFMPFITEEIWRILPHEGESVMVSDWPAYDEALCFAESEAEMERVVEAIRAVRARRAEMNVPPARRAKLIFVTPQPEPFRRAAAFLERLAGAAAVEFAQEGFPGEDMVQIVTGSARIFIPLGDLVDLAAERARLEKELVAAEKQLAAAEAKLQNEGFLAKAPEAVVEGAKENARSLGEKCVRLRESLGNLG
ncbi:MAG: valine--tRNA ligase [Oscillospiraceae bacterium]|jgi:valyl-tRNA synthetase|nr:valine--tRNA ligase [Oscillospiraceae bacterium]